MGFDAYAYAMTAILPSTLRGWFYYLSSTLVLAVALVANLHARDIATQSIASVPGEWPEQDFSQTQPHVVLRSR